MEHSPRHEAKAEGPLTAAFCLTAAVFVAEAAGGWWTSSLALLADAVHMGVDLLALGLSLVAARMARRPADSRRTFGYQRVEVLAALANGVWLLVATGGILREAYLRFLFPRPVMGPEMLAIAGLGLGCNVVSGLILLRGSRENINLRGAAMHVGADALGSLGAVVAACVVIATGWQRADPAASALICLGIMATSFWLLRDSVHILLEGAPSHIDLDEVKGALGALPGVTEVHDLHLWSLSQGSESLSGHLVTDGRVAQGEVLKAGTTMLETRFGLTHVTLQIET